MKIVHTCMRYPPAPGGAEIYVKFLAEEFVKRGHTVTVYTTDLVNHSLPDRLNDHRAFINGVRVKRLPCFLLPGWGYPVMPTLFFHLLFEKADLIQSHGIYYFPADVSAVVAKMRKIPYVIRPWFFHVDKSLFGVPFERWYFSATGRLQLNADRMVFATVFEKEFIEKRGYHAKNPSIIPQGVDVQGFGRSGTNILERFGVPSKNILLYVGRVDKGKGLDLLLQIAPQVIRKIPDVAFVIVGADFGYLNEMKRIIGEKKIQKHFYFTGQLHGQDIISAYRHATVFVFPSRYECLPTVLLEAMASQLPIVASNTAANPYVVEHEKTALLFDIHKLDEFLAQTLRLMQDSKLRARMKANQKAAILPYDRKKIVDELEKMYLLLVQNKRTGKRKL